MKGETSNVRFEEAKRLLDYGFSNFEYIENNKKGDIIKTIEIDKGVASDVDVVCEDDNRFTYFKKQN